jgi:RHS repeat-associated protein
MKPSHNILSFGINGSLCKREVQHPMPYTEYYLFNSAANLKAYSNNLTDFAYYGYNASNTRAYKLSMLNQNQWVNGQPFPLHFLCWLKENEAKERAFCGGEKNPVHHARQLAERRNPLRSHRSAPLPCYGKRIFSVTPQVGEITTEYNANFYSNILPKYAFNAKELDEETGMYYYDARYYNPPVFTSRDPMFEKYFWMTPYAYCANNPV